MNRRRALVVVPVLLLCVAGLYLLARGERDDRRPSGPTTTTTATEAGPTTARQGPTLAPPVPTTATTGPGPTTGTGPGSETEAAPNTATEGGSGTTPAGVRLRGVRGRVVSAADGTPIAGAFVSWGAPPQKVLDAIRSSPALLEAGEGGEITDASGRFDLPRVDDVWPRAELFASAAGWLQASTVVGLREELELRLERCGRLAVRFLGEPEIPTESTHGPRSRRLLRGVVAEGPAGARHSAPRGEWPTVLEVAPGRWRVQLDGGAPVEGVVVAGAATTIEVGAPAEVTVEGEVTGIDVAGLREADVELVRVGELGSTAPAVARSEYPYLQLEGRTFRWSLPAGVYWARVRLRLTPGLSGETSEVSERTVAAPIRIAAPGPVKLELALAPTAAVEVHLVLGALEAPRALGLVSADGDPPELVALLPAKNPGGGGPVRFLGQAPPGRFSAFHGPTYLGEVDVAEGTPATLTARPFDVTVRWRVPEALRDGEVLRGALAVVPLELARRPIGARFREDAAQPFDASRGGEPFHLNLLAPGRYLLAGSTDLGPFEREVELTGAAEVEVDLTGK